MPFELAALTLPALLAIFATAAALTWYSGTKATIHIDAIARRFELGQALAGMLLLGGVTSLPEIATAGTASANGDPLISMNDLIGSASMNLMLLAVGDLVYGRDALTSFADRPVTLMQGVLGMILFAGLPLCARRRRAFRSAEETMQYSRKWCQPMTVPMIPVPPCANLGNWPTSAERRFTLLAL
jgi:cation:H+ antiporter